MESFTYGLRWKRRCGPASSRPGGAPRRRAATAALKQEEAELREKLRRRPASSSGVAGERRRIRKRSAEIAFWERVWILYEEEKNWRRRNDFFVRRTNEVVQCDSVAWLSLLRGGGFIIWHSVNKYLRHLPLRENRSVFFFLMNSWCRQDRIIKVNIKLFINANYRFPFCLSCEN